MRAAALVVVAGCIPVAGPNHAGGDQADQIAATTATILVPETFVDDGRLYTSFQASASVIARLRRGDAVLGELPGVDLCDAVRDPNFVQDGDPPYDERCSWAVAELTVGRYTIDLRSMTGVELARADFDVIAVPAAGGTTALAVDPAVRIGVPYVHYQALWMWWPLDARYDWRSIQLHGFAGDEHRGMTSDGLQGPRLRRAGDAAVRVGLVTWRLEDSHAVDAIVATAGRHVLGAWRPPASPSMFWAPVRPSDAMTRAAVAAIEERIQETTVEYDDRHRIPMLGRQIVPRVCAAITSAAAMTQVEELLDNDDTAAEGVTMVHTSSSGATSASSGALISGPPAWDTGRTHWGVMQEITPSYRSMLRKLDGKTGAFKKPGDCFARVFGALPWMLPEPDPDEPDYRDTCGPTDGCPAWSAKRDPYAK